MAADPGAFGRRLRELRESAALSQEELAERANLTAKAIGALERGERRRPYPNTVRALAAGLGLDDESARELADAARPPTAATPPTRAASTTIPAPPTPTLGRGSEIARVTGLLELPTTRLVTLTGPGGVGKTRVASEVARGIQSDGREVVVVVELAAIRRVDLVVPTIAQAFGLTAGSEDPIGWIVGSVAERAPLLVLDNVEHLLGAANEISVLLDRCPTVVVLATSRAPLRIRAEHEVPIGPLTTPSEDGGVDVVAASPAAQMFVDRARAVAPDFAVDASNAAAVTAICRRLDGLPLALELAAAHVRYLPPPQLLERLGHTLGSARQRDLPERQRTITATLDWSRELLTSDEQDVWGALSVFAGGFEVAAAEVVAAAPDRDVLAALEGLVEQSLVSRADPDGGAGASRLGMLESVREYAAGSLADDDRVRIATRHATYFAALAADARTGLRSSELPRWLDALDADHANLRAALTTLLDHGERGAAARLGSDTWLYWALRGHAGEGLIWWQRVLDERPDPELDDAGRAAAHVALAGLRFATGDIERTRTHGSAAAVAARSAEDRTVLSEALLLSCMGALFAGDLAAATGHLDELSGLGVDEAALWMRAHVLIARAQMSLLAGRPDDCGVALDAAEGLARGGAGQFTLGTVLNIRTTMALLADDDDAALRNAAEAVQLAADVGTTWTLVYTLSTLATLAVRSGRPDLAAELFSAGAAAAEASLVEVSFRPDRESAGLHLEQVREQLSSDEFDRCWARGRELSVEVVLELIPEISSSRAPS